MKTFKQHLLEATITVPAKVLEPIRKYLLDVYEEVRLSGKQRLRNRGQVFTLDLSETKYEYLNDVAKQKPVHIKLMYSPGFGASVHYDARRKYKDYGEIQLNLADIRDAYGESLEHEIVHYIQDLMNIKIGKSEWKDEIAGGMKRKIRPKGVMFHGYKKDVYDKWAADWKSGKTRRRLKRMPHRLRPTEHQSNMVSMLYDLVKSMHDNPGNSKNSVFKQFIKYNKRMNKLKVERPDQYKEYVKRLYAAWVEKDLDQLKTYKQLKDAIAEIGAKTIEAMRKRREQSVENNTSIFIGNKGEPITEEQLKRVGSVAIYREELYDFTDLDGINQEFSFDLITSLASPRENAEGYEYYRISFNYPKIKNIFEKIRQERDEAAKNGSSYEDDDNSIHKILTGGYDEFAKTLAGYYHDKLNDKDLYLGQDGPEQILNKFYRKRAYAIRKK